MVTKKSEPEPNTHASDNFRWHAASWHRATKRTLPLHKLFCIRICAPLQKQRNCRQGAQIHSDKQRCPSQTSSPCASINIFETTETTSFSLTLFHKNDRKDVVPSMSSVFDDKLWMDSFHQKHFHSHDVASSTGGHQHVNFLLRRGTWWNKTHSTCESDASVSVKGNSSSPRARPPRSSRIRNLLTSGHNPARVALTSRVAAVMHALPDSCAKRFPETAARTAGIATRCKEDLITKSKPVALKTLLIICCDDVVNSIHGRCFWSK